MHHSSQPPPPRLSLYATNTPPPTPSTPKDIMKDDETTTADSNKAAAVVGHRRPYHRPARAFARPPPGRVGTSTSAAARQQQQQQHQHYVSPASPVQQQRSPSPLSLSSSPRQQHQQYQYQYSPGGTRFKLPPPRVPSPRVSPRAAPPVLPSLSLPEATTTTVPLMPSLQPSTARSSGGSNASATAALKPVLSPRNGSNSSPGRGGGIDSAGITITTHSSLGSRSPTFTASTQQHQQKQPPLAMSSPTGMQVVHQAQELHSNERAGEENVSTELPPGWQEMVDPVSGRPYYYNTIESATSWDRPVVVAAAAAAAAAVDATTRSSGSSALHKIEDNASAVEGQQEEQDFGEGGIEAVAPDGQVVSPQTKEGAVVVDDDVTEGATAPGPVDVDEFMVVPEQQESSSDLLPDGWQEAIDPGTGRTYFYNSLDGTTSWERPTIVPISTDTATASGAKAEPESSLLYAEEQARREVEERVDSFLQSHDEAGKGVGPPLVGQDDAPFGLIGEDNIVANHSNKESPLEDHMPASETALELSEGWEEVVDSDSGRIYYYNAAENLTSWDLPTPAAGTDSKDGATLETDFDGEEAQQTYYDEQDVPDENPEANPCSVDGSVPADGDLRDEPLSVSTENATTPPALPEGWEELVDTDSGRTYFYNAAENATTWDRPLAEDATEAPIVPPFPGESASALADVADSVEPAGIPPSEASEMVGTSSLPNVAVKSAYPATMPRRADEQSGAGKVVKISAGSVPEVQERIAASVENDLPGGGENLLGSPLQEDSRAFGGELPAGWQELVDPSSGNIYYYNYNENRTSWERPKHTSETQSGISEALDAEGETPEKPKIYPDQLDVEDETTLEQTMGSEELATEGSTEAQNRAASPEGFSVGDRALQETKDGGYVEDPTTNHGITKEDVPDELPAGWQELVDPSSGVVYYYNADDDALTWERPTIAEETDEAADSEVAGDFEVLESNENGTDEDGGHPSPPPEEMPAVGFLFHENIPVTEAEDGEEGCDALPDGWEQIIDSDSGSTYYFNASENVSSWERPVVGKKMHTDAQEDDDSALAAPGEPVVEECDDLPPAERVSEVESAGDFGEVSGEVVHTLSAGWEELVDPSSGEIYYYNASEDVSSWKRPQAVEELPCDDEPETAAPEAEHVHYESPEETTTSDDDAIAHSENDLVGPRDSEETPELQVEIEWEPTEDEPQPYSDDDLPQGWAVLVDEDSGRPFYYCEAEGISSWEKPTQTEVPGVDSAEPTREAPAETELRLDQDPKKHDAGGSNEPESAPEETTTAPTTACTLPDGWTELIDTSNGQPYYMSDDGVTSWERPSGPCYLTSDVIGTTIASDGRECAAGENQLPEGWEELVDSTSGDVYYYNKFLELTSWERPQVSDAAHESEILVQSPTDPHEDPDHGVQAESLDLPPEWTEALDPQSGETFYINEKDGSTSWERPSATVGNYNEEAKAITGSDEDVQPQEERHREPPVNEEKKPVEEAPLPPGWKEVVDPSSGGVYYVNESQNETTWERPLGGMTPGTGGESSVKVQVNDLPVGWEEVVDPSTGRPYYLNPITNETRWDRPESKTQATETMDEGSQMPCRESKRMRPAHAIATFGFGGRLCTLRRTNDSFTVLSIRRTFTVIPSDPLIRSEQAKGESGFFGPLNSADDSAVLSYIRKRASSKQELLWNLVSIASQSHGMLRSENLVGDSNSPEHAVVRLLLQDSEATADNGSANDPILKSTYGKNDSLHSVQELVINGKKEEAAKEAAAGGHFALSLMLASMCGQTMYQQAIANYAENSLLAGSPLYTIAMLFSTQVKPNTKGGFWGSESKELHNNWKTQLAAIINNRSRGWDSFGVSLGDELLRIGEVEAAHFCYVFCGCPVASLAREARLTLLGCKVLPEDLTLMTEEAISAFERTEAYEWAKRRGNSNATILCLQPFKLMYAILLADFGFEETAKRYIQSIIACLGGRDAKGGINGPLSMALITSDAESTLATLGEFEQRLSRGCEESSAPPVLKAPLASYPIAKADALPTRESPLRPVQGEAQSAKTATAGECETGGQQIGLTANSDQQQALIGEHERTNKPEIPSSLVDRPPLGMRPPTKRPHQVEGKMVAPSGSLGPSPMKSIPTVLSAEQPPAFFAAPVATQIPESLPRETLAPGAATASTPTKMHTLQPPPNQSPDSTPICIASSPSQELAASSTKPVSAPMSAPANLEQSSNRSTPSSSGKKRGFFDFGIKSKMTKWLNPDATQADLGEGMQAYYDDKLKCWVFPGEDPAEKAKPIGPPPMTPQALPAAAASTNATAAAPAANDPLAAMMAPPKRAPNGFQAKAKSMGAIPFAGGPPMPGMMVMPGAGTPVAAPQFAVFMPKPSAENDAVQGE